MWKTLARLHSSTSGHHRFWIGSDQTSPITVEDRCDRHGDGNQPETDRAAL
jgi:hypothetical protein